MVEPVDLEDEHDDTKDADKHVTAHLHELDLSVKLVILHKHASTWHVEDDQGGLEDWLNLYLFVQPLQSGKGTKLQGGKAEYSNHEEDWKGVGNAFRVVNCYCEATHIW